MTDPNGWRNKPSLSLDELLSLWDTVDDACDRVACALPMQMTDAADRLERARKEFRKGIQGYAFHFPPPPAQEEGK